MPSSKIQEYSVLLLMSLVGSVVGVGALLIARHYDEKSIVTKSPELPAGITNQTVLGPSSINDNTSGRNETLVVFQDFQCPPCASLHQVLSQSKPSFPIVYRNLPLPNHKNAKFRAIVAEAAREQGKFAEISNYLFSQNTTLTEQDIQKVCKEKGLDWSKLKVAMHGTAERRVSEDLRDVGLMKLQYTPTLIYVKPDTLPKIIASVADMK